MDRTFARSESFVILSSACMEAMKYSLVIIICLSHLSFIGEGVQAAIVEIFDGLGPGDQRSDWEAAVGGFYNEENFADGVWQGVTATPIGFGHSGFGVSGSHFNDRLTPSNSTELEFDAPITAFGANWDLRPGGPGLGIALEVDGILVMQEIPDFFSGQFFGFTSDVAFTRIVLMTGSQGGSAETYDLDNVVTSMTTIPEPSSIILLCVGALKMFVLRSLRHRQPVGQ